MMFDVFVLGQHTYFFILYFWTVFLHKIIPFPSLPCAAQYGVLAGGKFLIKKQLTCTLSATKQLLQCSPILECTTDSMFLEFSAKLCYRPIFLYFIP